MPGNRRTSARPRLSGAVDLQEGDVHPDPILQFGRWYEEALNANLVEPTAMTLATANREGIPSARMVLLKGYDDRGFVFFTNYESAKARDLGDNPNAALVFWWGALERQIRIVGPVTRVSKEESDAYFESRPIGSRLGAIASRQSTVLTNREDLERQVQELARQYPDGTIPRPEHWGGFRITPSVIEFWQGRPDRLHDRLRYTKSATNWKIDRLSP
jgi:pyridoxamine 5'-phosphate oxidase